MVRPGGSDASSIGTGWAEMILKNLALFEVGENALRPSSLIVAGAAILAVAYVTSAVFSFFSC